MSVKEMWFHLSVFTVSYLNEFLVMLTFQFPQTVRLTRNPFYLIAYACIKNYFFRYRENEILYKKLVRHEC